MQNYQVKKIQAWQWALIGAGATLLLALAGIGAWSLFGSKSGGSAIASSDKNTADSRLLGRWLIRDSIELLFAPDGKVYDVSGSKATVSDYKIVNSTDRSIEVTMYEGKISWFIEFMNDGNITIKDRNETTIGRRISDQTDLPSTVQRVTSVRSQRSMAIESEAQTYILTVRVKKR
jgi:hypothetical protein